MISPLITLTTDFGTEDAYVAQMKGQILAICPAARLIDITHSIPPQDIIRGALILAQAAPYFPADTIHLVVVDPEVGTARRMLAIEMDTRVAGGPERSRQRFVLPDNGLIGPLVARFGMVGATALARPEYWRRHVSWTFHGRDIMGPVAAHWANGATREQFGPEASDIVLCSWPEPLLTPAEAHGEIIAVDHFGNAVTNLPANWLPARADATPAVTVATFTAAAAASQARQVASGAAEAGLQVLVDGKPIAFRQAATYGQHPPGTPVLLAGSHELIELAVVAGSAAEQLRISPGSKVVVRTLG